MAANPYATLPAGELERTTAPLAWIVEGLFLEAGAGILGGAPKTGKSFFALDLCVAIASGTSCASSFRVLAPGPVVLLCAEDPQAVVSSRLSALARARGRALKDLPLEVIVETAVRLPDGLPRLEATLAAKKPRLLLLDPLIRLHRADENSASEMSIILDGLRGLARTSKTAILLVHICRVRQYSTAAQTDPRCVGMNSCILQSLRCDRSQARRDLSSAYYPPYRDARISINPGFGAQGAVGATPR